MTNVLSALYHPPFMSRSVLIDPITFTQHGENIRLNIQVNEFDKRIRSMLADTEGDCCASINGYIDSKQRPTLRLKVVVTLNVICQRCLKKMAFQVKSETRVILCPDQEQLNSILDNLEDTDAVLMESQIDIIKLIEDEIIMEFPYAPKHEQCAIGLPERNTGNPTNNPFSVLKQLKKD